MARQRAGQAKAAFARVGAAPVTGLTDGDIASTDASISASENDGTQDGGAADEIASLPDVGNAAGNAGSRAGARTGGKARARAGRSAGRNSDRKPRRVGRPRGPERVPLTIRILAETDERLTAAVEATGESPQYLVDAALTRYLDALGIAPVRQSA
jgi:hypothetical protein